LRVLFQDKILLLDDAMLMTPRLRSRLWLLHDRFARKTPLKYKQLVIAQAFTPTNAEGVVDEENPLLHEGRAALLTLNSPSDAGVTAMAELGTDIFDFVRRLNETHIVVAAVEASDNSPLPPPKKNALKNCFYFIYIYIYY